MDSRTRWLDQESPPNYVAGLGRGATGFTTRSDIGPARMAGPIDPIALAAAKPQDDDNDRGDYSESNYDEWTGFGGSFADPGAAYDQDDKEADEIWDAIDQRMDLKRKDRREKKLQQDLEKYRQTRPKIQQQFADIKRELVELTNEDWDLLLQGAKLKTFSKDEAIVVEGDSFQRIYQIVEGCCRIEIGGKVVGFMVTEDTFGEISFLLSGGATASVIADSETVDVYIMEGYFINILFGRKQELAGRFYKYLAHELQRRVRIVEENN